MRLYIILVALPICLAALFLAVRYILHRITDKKLESYQNDLLKKHYDEVENMYRQMRGWRHDYRNHIQTMKVYLSMGQLDLLDTYLSSLNDDLIHVDTVLKTGNVMADAIINSKLSLAKSKGIQVDATAQIPEKLTVSGTDMCVILGNILDNAVEACENMADPAKRFIRVYMGVLKGQLYISVSNSVGGKLKKSDGQYHTTKGANHGFGLKRIDKIVAGYAGYLNRQDEGDVFATEIMLPL